jgi:hypothetical protein
MTTVVGVEGQREMRWKDKKERVGTSDSYGRVKLWAVDKSRI